MIKNTVKSILIIGSGFLLSGCLASERDISTLKLQLQQLNATIAQMQSNQAELANKMDDLNQNLSVSSENMSQVGDQISSLSVKLDDLAARSTCATTTQKPVTQATAVLPSDLFAESKKHLDKEAYSSAIMGFNLYTAKYPEGEQIEQAYMYLGDAYLADGQAKPAAIAYATVLQKFPNSKYIPAARVKYAKSIIPLGKIDEAKSYLNSVIKDFPSAMEVSTAKEALSKLK